MARKFRWRVSGILVILLFFVGMGRSSSFPYRDSLAAEIKFWKQIFTEYSANQVLLHDSRHPFIIYRVVTFDSSITSREREREIRHQKKIIANLLNKLDSGEIPRQNLSAWEKFVIQQFDAISGSHKYAEAARQIRAQQGIRENFRAGVERSYRYMPYMQAIFREYHLPEQLVFIPHLESSFNPRARSHAGAVGMWQFMRRTARLFMRVNRYVDERYDPLKSTRAAARFLKNNFQQTSDWALAITAYNYGLNGIKRAARKFGTNYLQIRENYLNRRFGFASKSFYPEFLAVVEIMDSLSLYCPDLQPDSLLSFYEFPLPGRTNLKRFVKKTGVSELELRLLNPAFTSRVWKGWRSLPAGYKIRLPLGISPEFVLSAFYGGSAAGKKVKRRLVPRKKTASPVLAFNRNFREFPGRRTVTDRQLFQRIAEAFAGQISLLEPVNFPDTREAATKNLSPPEVGNSGEIPDGLAEIGRRIEEKMTVRRNAITVYPNETLGHYAQWLEIPVQRLRTLNKLTRRSKIYTGQILKLDFSVTTPAVFSRRRVRYHLNQVANVIKNDQKMRLVAYRVSRGENLWNIANRDSTLPPEMIFYFNRLNKLSHLMPGDVIAVPVLYN